MRTKYNKYYLGGSVSFDNGMNQNSAATNQVYGSALNMALPGVGSLYQGASSMLDGIEASKKTIDPYSGRFESMSEVKKGNAVRAFNPLNNITDAATTLFDKDASSKEKLFAGLGAIGPLGFLGAKANNMKSARIQQENVSKANTARNIGTQREIDDITGKNNNRLANGGKVIDLNKGFNTFESGGTHESNPFGGIPISLDENGVPNLVEQGETKKDDYIFSNRLKLDASEPFKLNKEFEGKSYSEISKSLNKGLSERPNDSISNRTFNQMTDRLKSANEYSKELNIFNNNSFKCGGKIK